MLGMFLGSLLLAGAGRSLLVLLAAIVFFEVKIREEERLMAATFPEEYAATGNGCRSSSRDSVRFRRHRAEDK